jgi:t-SNARE complex subunit (syntaxin)
MISILYQYNINRMLLEVVDKSHEEFMKSLVQDTAQQKLKIEKDMNYVYKTFQDFAYLTEFQDTYVQEIDKSLQKAEENSKALVNSLKKANDKAGCYQRLLNSIIIVLVVSILLLSLIAVLKSRILY